MKLRCNIEEWEHPSTFRLYIETKNKDGEWITVAERLIKDPKDKSNYILLYLGYQCVSVGGGLPYFNVQEIKI